MWVEFQGHYYDCETSKQADRYVTTAKEIPDHVGRTYVNVGYIRNIMDDEKLFVIPKPVDPL